MMNRVLTGWTFTRALYVVLGLYIIINSYLNQQWMGMVFGGYFASMGIFAFGCASGACYPVQRTNTKADIQEVEYEEIKK